jgi:hypothetical protein
MRRRKAAELERLARGNQTSGPDHPDLRHHRVEIRHKGQSAWVDEGVAQAVLWFWRQGVDTVGSCQNVHEWRPDKFDESSDGIALIGFPLSSYRPMCALLGVSPQPKSPNVAIVARLFRIGDGGLNLVSMGSDDGEIAEFDTTEQDLQQSRLP